MTSPDAKPAASLPQTPRTTLKRHAERGSHERATIYAIIDEALCCHVGFELEGRPFVLPTAHARAGDRLYVHGARANRMFRALADGREAAVTFTLLDGLVLARTAFHHSMNFRCVTLFSHARELLEPADQRAALDALVEHIAPGRSRETRAPSDEELRATLVLELQIAEASAKIRSGPPLDSGADLAHPCWAGELPLRLQLGAPVPDPALPAGTPLSAAVLARQASWP